MNYSSVLLRAARITFRHPWLWIFGFSLGVGRTIADSLDICKVESQPFSPSLCRLFSSLVLYLPELLVKGSLIAGVGQVLEIGNPGFWRALRVGFVRLPHLFLLWLPISSLYALISHVTLPFLLIFVLSLPRSLEDFWTEVEEQPVRILLRVAIPAGIVVPFLLVYWVFTLGERAVVLESYNAPTAFGHSMRVLFKRLLPVLVLTAFLLVFFTIEIGFILASRGLIAVPIVGSQGADPAASSELATVPSLLIELLVMLLLSPLRTFSSAVWTLAYRELVQPEIRS